MDEEGDLYQLNEDDIPVSNWAIYRVKRLYYKKKSSSDLKKHFYVIQGKYNT